MSNDDNHEYYQDEAEYNYFMSMIDKKLIEFELEIALHSIIEEGKISEFKVFCEFNRDLNLWELIKKFNEKS